MPSQGSRARTTLCFVALSLCAAAPCLAGPPLITDDPVAIDKGHWEINIPYTLTESRRQTQMETPLLDVNYGLTDQVQLNYAVAWLVSDSAGPAEEGEPQDTHSGLSNSEIGAKVQFVDQEKSGFDLSIHPAIEINNPTRSRRRHLVESGSVLTLPVQVGRDFGRFQTFADVGYQFVQFAGDQAFVGVAVGYKLTERFQLLGEVFTTFDAAWHDVDPIANVGFSWGVSEHANLLFAVGRSLRDTPESEAVVLYAGVQLEL